MDFGEILCDLLEEWDIAFEVRICLDSSTST